MLTSLYEVNVTDVITKKDTKEFVSKIYEWKKPVKTELIKILDEKYGINVTNLKFVPTFNNLAKSNSVMCEVISILGDKKGVVPDVLKTFSSFLAKKGGVEVLDVSDFLSECLKEGGVAVIEENMLMNYIDMPRLARDLMALKILIGGDAAMGGEPGMGGEEIPPEEGDEFGEEEEGFEGEEGEFGDEQNGEFGEEDQVPGEEPAPGEDAEWAPETEPQAGTDPSQQELGAEDTVPVNGEEVPPEGAGIAPQVGGGEEVVGDDSVEDGEVDPQAQQGQGVPPKPGAGGGMSSLVSDLEALVAGLGIGGGPKRPKRPQPQRPRPEDGGQYGA